MGDRGEAPVEFALGFGDADERDLHGAAEVDLVRGLVQPGGVVGALDGPQKQHCHCSLFVHKN